MSLSAGTPFTIDANGSNSTAVAKLSATASIVVYHDSVASDFECRVVQDDETVGAADTVESNAASGTGNLAVAALSATKAIAVWVNSTSGATVGIITISGTTATFETGSVLGLANNNDGADGQVGIVATSSTSAIMTYDEQTNQRGVYLTISGTTITEESDVVVDASGDSVSIVKLSSTKAVISYGDTGDSGIAKACVLSVSGTTISAGTPQNLEASDLLVTVGGSALGEISSTQCLCAYSNDTDDALEAVVLSISGTTITVNTPTTIDTWTEPNKIQLVSMIAYSTTQFAVIYADQMADVTVSGTAVTDNGSSAHTTDTPTWNAAVSFSSTKAINIYSSSTKAVIITAAATTWGYDVIPSAGGNARDSFCASADGEYLFFALEDDTTSNQGVFRVVRPTSTTPTTALQYDPGGGSGS